MKRFFLAAVILFFAQPAFAQTSSQYLSASIAKKCAVVGDSNVGYIARQVIEEGSHLAETGLPVAPVVTFDFVGMVYGSGLRDLQAFQTRLADPKIHWADYDCVVINLGLGDILLEDANWNAFFAGTYSSIGPAMTYAMRAQTLLNAIPASVHHIYWVGVHSASTMPAISPWEVAAVDLTLACIDSPSSYPGWCVSEDTRLHYVHPDTLIATVNPKLVDNLHYTPAAGTAIYRYLAHTIGVQP